MQRLIEIQLSNDLQTPNTLNHATSPEALFLSIHSSPSSINILLANYEILTSMFLRNFGFGMKYFVLALPLDLPLPRSPPKRAWWKTGRRVWWTSSLEKRRHRRRRPSLPSPSRFSRRHCGRQRRVLGSRWSSTRRRWSRRRREGPVSWLPTESSILFLWQLLAGQITLLK